MSENFTDLLQYSLNWRFGNTFISLRPIVDTYPGKKIRKFSGHCGCSCGHVIIAHVTCALFVSEKQAFWVALFTCIADIIRESNLYAGK